MFFRKKHSKEKVNERIHEYFMYRDSLTALTNNAYAVKRYNELKDNESGGAVMVVLDGCDSLPIYKAEKLISETGLLLPRILEGEFSRLQFGEFILFTQKVEEDRAKLEFFLGNFAENGQNYMVSGGLFDTNESFELFLRRMRRCGKAKAYENAQQKR